MKDEELVKRLEPIDRGIQKIREASRNRYSAIIYTFLALSVSMGPIDLTRSVCTNLMGDTPVLKQQLLDYTREQIRSNISTDPERYNNKGVESALAAELGYELGDGETVDAQRVGMGRLWEAVEDNTSSIWDQFIGPTFRPKTKDY